MPGAADPDRQDGETTVAVGNDRIVCKPRLWHADARVGDESLIDRMQLSARSCRMRREKKGHVMDDVPGAYEFTAYLPRLAAPVRIGTYADAQVFVRRWTIREKDRTVRELARRMERANSAENMDLAMSELRRELAARGMLSAPQLP
jgi:hypothetical protein